MRLTDCQSCPAQLQYHRELSRKQPPQSVQVLQVGQMGVGLGPGDQVLLLSIFPRLGRPAWPPPHAAFRAPSSRPRQRAASRVSVRKDELGEHLFSAVNASQDWVPITSCGSSDEPGASQELNEDSVHECVLAESLHHHHPLLPQHVKHPWDVQHLIVFQTGDHDL